MLLALVMLFAGCQKYDDSALSGRVDDLEGRVSELEKLVADLNSNVQTLSVSVKALENEDRIVSITPLSDGSGYEIVFSKMGKMVIKNGEKPSISVEQGEDGVWYWTVDGEPLLADGNKIPATIAPEFKIENGQLWFRLNGGEWTVIPGAETGIGLVQDVRETEEDVTLVLSDGREITIPKVQSFALEIEAPYSGVDAGEYISMSYTVTAGDEETTVTAICDGGFTADVRGNSKSGTINITAPYQVPASASVLIVAVNGKGQMSGKILSFEKGELSLVENTVTIGNQGGEISIKINTNMNYETPRIDPSAGWISQIVETKAMRTDELKYYVEPYDGSQGESRQGNIYITYGNGKQETFTVVQLNENVVSGGKSDFETFNATSPNVTVYTDSNASTASGWHINEYCLVLTKETAANWTEINGIYPILGGVVTEPGVLYSPEIEGGCGNLTLRLGTHAGASLNKVGWGISVIVSNGTDTKTFPIIENNEAQENLQYKVREERLEVNITGTVTITIKNDCIHNNTITMQKMKDGIGILSVEWTGYSE